MIEPQIRQPFALKIATWIGRKLFPLRPEQALPWEEMESFRREAKSIEIKIGLMGIPIVALLSFGLMWWLTELEQADARATPNAIVLGREFTGIALGLVGGFVLLFAATQVIPVLVLGPRVALYRRYNQTKKGYDQAKLLVLLVITTVLLMGGAGIATWRGCPIFTSDRLRFRPTFQGVTWKPYSAVRGIAVYERVSGLLGVNRVRSLRIEFDSGPELLTTASSEGDAASLETAARLTSEKTGIAIKRGDIRPD